MSEAVRNWINASLVLLSAFGLSGLTCTTVTGCQGGLPLMAQANPQTSVKIEPLSKQIEIFSNDGKTFEATNVKFTSTQEGTTFGADEISVSDRSVENRGANVAQIEAGAKQIKALGEVVVGCAAEIRRILNPASGVVDSLGDAAPKLAAIASKLESAVPASQPVDEYVPHED